MRYALPGLALVAVCFSPGPMSAADRAAAPPDLDAVLQVEVTGEGVIGLRFDTPGGADQSFESSEYRYALLDKGGVQLGREQADRALVYLGTAVHTADLPGSRRSAPDYSDYVVSFGSLRSGEEYYLVVSVRNLTGLARFKAP